MTAKDIRITGHVQGVFFRAGAQEHAMRLGVNGWVRNNPDGSVEMHVEGEDDALVSFIGWCKAGPSGASVETCEVKDSETEDHTTFEIWR